MNVSTIDLAERYQSLGEINRGGMGRILKVRDLYSGELLALKMLISAPTNSEIIERFIREAQSLLAIDHPNVLKLRSFGMSEHGPFLCSELVDGQSLNEIVTRAFHKDPEGTNIPWLCEIFARLADALQICHEHGVLHRDLKPENILIERETNRPVIIDFGAAQIERDSATSLEEFAQTLTQTGMLVGTPAFMAPEQVDRGRFGPPSPATDLWGLAATLYFCLTNHTPFEKDSMLEQYAALLSSTPPPPKYWRASIPEYLNAVLEDCLRPDPAERLSLTSFRERINPRREDPSRPARTSRSSGWIRASSLFFLSLSISVLTFLFASSIFVAAPDTSSRLTPQELQELLDLEEYLLLRELDPSAIHPHSDKNSVQAHYLESPILSAGAASSRARQGLSLLRQAAAQSPERLQLEGLDPDLSGLLRFLRKKNGPAPRPWLRHPRLSQLVILLAKSKRTEALDAASSIQLLNPRNDRSIRNIEFQILVELFCAAIIDPDSQFKTREASLVSLVNLLDSPERISHWRDALHRQFAIAPKELRSRLFDVLKEHGFSELPGKTLSIPPQIIWQKYLDLQSRLLGDSFSSSLDRTRAELECARLNARCIEHELSDERFTPLSERVFSLISVRAARAETDPGTGARDQRILSALWDAIIAQSRVGNFDRVRVHAFDDIQALGLFDTFIENAVKNDPLDHALAQIWLGLHAVRAVRFKTLRVEQSPEKVNQAYLALARGLENDAVSTKIRAEAYRARAFIQSFFLDPAIASSLSEPLKERLGPVLSGALEERRTRVEDDYLKSIELGCDEPDEIYLDLAEHWIGLEPERRLELLELVVLHTQRRAAESHSDESSARQYAPTTAAETAFRLIAVALNRAELLTRHRDDKPSALAQLEIAGKQLKSMGPDNYLARERLSRVLCCFIEMNEAAAALTWIDKHCTYLAKTEQDNLRQMVKVAGPQKSQ